MKKGARPPRVPERSPWRAWGIPAVVGLATFLAFLPTLQNEFVEWDDNTNLVNNPHYRGLGWRHLRWMFTTVLMGHWIPVTWLTFGADYLAWGMNPAGYHLTSLLLHTANALVFYVVALRLFRASLGRLGETPRRLGAGAAALFFAVHPLRVESVAWATERRDVLSGLFFLLTILTYLSAAQAEGGARRRWWGLSVGCYALAVGSKAIVMTLPAVLILLDVYPLRRLSGRWRDWITPDGRRVWLEKVPYVILAVGAAGMAVVAQRGGAEPETVATYPLSARVAVAGYGLWFYLWKTMVPLALSPLYERPTVVNALAPGFVLSAAAVAAITAGLFVLRRRWPAGFLVWLCYGLVLAPVSGLAQSGPQLVAARYSYLSCLGWALLVGAAIGLLAQRAATGPPAGWSVRVGTTLVVLWFVALGALTWTHVRVWHDSETLWRRTLAVDPTSGVAHNNLGDLLRRKGRLPEAAAHLQQALQLRPDDPRVRFNWGILLAAQGQLDAAIGEFRRTLELRPDFAAAHIQIGLILAGQGRLNDANSEFHRALEVADDRAVAHNHIGVGLRQLGYLPEAIEHYQEALRLDPTLPSVHYNLGVALAAQGELPQAIGHFRRALELRPDLAEARRSLARALAAQRPLKPAPDPAAAESSTPPSGFTH